MYRKNFAAHTIVVSDKIKHKFYLKVYPKDMESKGSKNKERLRIPTSRQ